MRALVRRLAGLFRRRAGESRLSEEVRFHLEMLEQEYRARGMPEREAAQAARRAFGGVEPVKERWRDQRSLPSIESFLVDLRHAWRGLRHTPGFTAAAVLSLALGIGANTAIFTVFNAIMLRMLPVAKPDELVRIKKVGAAPYLQNFSYHEFELFRARREIFQDVLACWGPSPTRYEAPPRGAAEFASREFVSPNYFRMLGVRPAAGRLLGIEDEGRSVVVLSHDFWRGRFGADPEVIGRALRLHDADVAVIGVAAPGFRGLDAERPADLWVPLSTIGPVMLEGRTTRFLRIMARRHPYVPLDQIQPVIQAIHRRELDETVKKGSPWYAEYRKAQVRADAGGAGLSRLRDQFRRPLLVLLAVVGTLFAIACLNVANLLLARGAARRRDAALRVALGGSRARLIRQLMSESVLIALAGGAAGFLLALWGSQALVAFLPGGEGVLPLDVRPDSRVLAFTVAVSALAALSFGLVPAIRATRADPARALQEGGLASLGGRVRPGLRHALVTAQVAFSMALLVAAALFLRTLAGLRLVDAGFRAGPVLTFYLNTPPEYTPAGRESLLRRAMEAVRGIPGVAAAGYSGTGAFRTGRSTRTVEVFGSGEPQRIYVDDHKVGAGFLQALQVPLVRGRLFQEADQRAEPQSAIVNEEFAARYLPGRDPLLARIEIAAQRLAVVGVVRNVLHQGLREPVAPIVYLPMPPGDGLVWAVRAATSPESLAGAVRATLRRLDPGLAVADLRPLQVRIDESLVEERTVAALCGAFGGLALLLAAVGLYGTLSYFVAQRTPEIGIRMALGAQRRSVVWFVFRQGLALIAVGLSAGVPLALAVSRLGAGLLFQVKPWDQASLTAAAAVLVLVGGVATLLPARRASAIHPLQALRRE